MPEFKKQHYLPSAYLKYFSVDQNNCSRDSLVWRFGINGLKRVPVVSQCSGDYFFSREKAAQTEKAFQKAENAYCRCVDKIRLNEEPAGMELGDLVLVMFDLHLRNAVHKNKTGKEGIDAYNIRSQIFFKDILINKHSSEITKEDIVSHIRSYWRVEIISVNSENYFITSDHPSVWTTLDRYSASGAKPSLYFVTLPLTPKHTAIAFDQRRIQIVSKSATAEDEKTLNIGQIQHADRCVFMSFNASDEQLAILKSHFGRKTISSCELTADRWKLAIQQLPEEFYFSFMRLTPPLL